MTVRRGRGEGRGWDRGRDGSGNAAWLGFGSRVVLLGRISMPVCQTRGRRHRCFTGWLVAVIAVNRQQHLTVAVSRGDTVASQPVLPLLHWRAAASSNGAPASLGAGRGTVYVNPQAFISTFITSVKDLCAASWGSVLVYIVSSHLFEMFLLNLYALLRGMCNVCRTVAPNTFQSSYVHRFNIHGQGLCNSSQKFNATSTIQYSPAYDTVD